MKFQSWYDYFVVFIVIIKISFFILSLSLIYLKIKNHGKPETETMKTLTYWKERVEFIFILDIAILLTYLFYPKREKPIPIDNVPLATFRVRNSYFVNSKMGSIF